ncbi:MAG TPA: hypothetical protein EYP30_02710 [Archaeoglobaceae archaeon]|nr:hypothetical protein [Archaeoglobaceae archaeon]
MEKNTIYIVVGLLAGVIIGLFLMYSLLTPQYNPYYGNYPMEPMMGRRSPIQYSSDSDRRYYPPYGQDRYYPPGCCQGPANFTSNGESIYFTGINEEGERIPLTGGAYQDGK